RDWSSDVCSSDLQKESAERSGEGSEYHYGENRKHDVENAGEDRVCAEAGPCNRCQCGLIESIKIAGVISEYIQQLTCRQNDNSGHSHKPGDPIREQLFCQA